VLHPLPWIKALQGTVIPHLSFKADYLTALIAVLDTTISPYLFFWQVSEEAEEIETTPADNH
jgi:Mn2+/Fe2+ NRAMP family transporter